MWKCIYLYSNYIIYMFKSILFFVLVSKMVMIELKCRSLKMFNLIDTKHCRFLYINFVSCASYFSSPLIKEKLIKTSNMGHKMQMYDFKRLFFKSYNCLIILNSYPRSCNPNLTFLPILLYKGTCFLFCLNAKCCQHMEGKYHSVSHTHTKPNASRHASLSSWESR